MSQPVAPKMKGSIASQDAASRGDNGEDKAPEQYEIEDAARTLTKAQEIRSNKKLMPHVHKHLKKQKKMIAGSIADLKAMHAAMNDHDEDDM